MRIRVGAGGIAMAIALGAAAATLGACRASGPARPVSPVDTVSSASAGTSAPSRSSNPSPTAAAARRADVAAPAAVRNGCAHNTAARAVRVSLRTQHLWMCAGSRLVRDTPITSGAAGQYTSTPTGHYVVQGFQRDTTLTLISGASFAVKYWIPFDGPLFGFHDSSWQDFPYGSPLYKARGSHGCVHVPLKAIAFLARWSSAGTTQVLIHA